MAHAATGGCLTQLPHRPRGGTEPVLRDRPQHPRFDANGSYYTYCRKEQVGHCLVRDGQRESWVETDRFVIVSTRRVERGGPPDEFVILTAFPVLRDY